MSPLSAGRLFVSSSFIFSAVAYIGVSLQIIYACAADRAFSNAGAFRCAPRWFRSRNSEEGKQDRRQGGVAWASRGRARVRQEPRNIARRNDGENEGYVHEQVARSSFRRGKAKHVQERGAGRACG